MGQYYKIVNTTKRQYLDPSAFGDGLKLMAFANSESGVMSALALLLAQGNGKGGGDFRGIDKMIGSWAGDSIIVLGDYSEMHFEVPGIENPRNYDLYNMLSVKKFGFKDISTKLIKLMVDTNPHHPLARVVAININSKKNHSFVRRNAWGDGPVFLEPQQKHIKTFSQLMSVATAAYGEVDEITNNNLAWGLQCLFGDMNALGLKIENSSGGHMEITHLQKNIENVDFSSVSLQNLDFDVRRHIAQAGKRVSSVIFTMKNSNTNKKYQHTLIFPCSLSDIHSMMVPVLQA